MSSRCRGRIAPDNVTRDDDTPIHRSVREVVANALIHADYHGRQGIVIDKYPKRIEVSNPGILRISKAVAVSGGTSDARNAKIFNIFSLVKIGERSGMGLAQLYGNWEEAGYARPQLSESFNPERTKVEIEVEVAENLGKVAENSSQVAEKQGEVAVKYTEKDTETRSGYTEKVTEKFGDEGRHDGAREDCRGRGVHHAEGSCHRACAPRVRISDSGWRRRDDSRYDVRESCG